MNSTFPATLNRHMAVLIEQTCVTHYIVHAVAIHCCRHRRPSVAPSVVESDGAYKVHTAAS